MTLDGTNSYVVGHEDQDSVLIVDPGPGHAEHVERLRSFGTVEMVLLTHGHRDHSESARSIARTTGATVRAIDAAQCAGAPPLRDGEVIGWRGLSIRAVATPGHTEDSACFEVGTERGSRVMLTGDTILGGSSSAISRHGGSLTEHLASLKRLAGQSDRVVGPGHGHVLPSLREAAESSLRHRHRRLSEIADLLGQHGRPLSVEPGNIDLVTTTLYAPNPALQQAVRNTVRACLVYLASGAYTNSENQLPRQQHASCAPIEQTLDSESSTRDLGGTADTKQFTTALISHLKDPS